MAMPTAGYGPVGAAHATTHMLLRTRWCAHPPQPREPAPGAGSVPLPPCSCPALGLLLPHTWYQQVWALPSCCPALGTEQGPRGERTASEGGPCPSHKPPLPHLPQARPAAQQQPLLPWPSGQPSGKGGQLCCPCCPSVWATVGTGLLQPPGPLALVKNRATYKNIYILTPYKLLTIDTQMAAEGECTQQGHRRGNNLVGKTTGGTGSLPEAWILSRGEMSAQEVGPGTARCT